MALYVSVFIVRPPFLRLCSYSSCDFEKSEMTACCSLNMLNVMYHDSLHPAKASRLRWWILLLLRVFLRTVSTSRLSSRCLFIHGRFRVILVKLSKINIIYRPEILNLPQCFVMSLTSCNKKVSYIEQVKETSDILSSLSWCVTLLFQVFHAIWRNFCGTGLTAN